MRPATATDCTTQYYRYQTVRLVREAPDSPARSSTAPRCARRWPPTAPRCGFHNSASSRGNSSPSCWRCWPGLSTRRLAAIAPTGGCPATGGSRWSGPIPGTAAGRGCRPRTAARRAGFPGVDRGRRGDGRGRQPGGGQSLTLRPPSTTNAALGRHLFLVSLGGSCRPKPGGSRRPCDPPAPVRLRPTVDRSAGRRRARRPPARLRTVRSSGGQDGHAGRDQTTAVKR